MVGVAGEKNGFIVLVDTKYLSFIAKMIRKKDIQLIFDGLYKRDP